VRAFVYLAIYTAVVSLTYAVLSLLAPAAAAASLVFFVALLLVPACVHDVKRARRRRGRP
jgi:hypothetical protein